MLQRCSRRPVCCTVHKPHVPRDDWCWLLPYGKHLRCASSLSANARSTELLRRYVGKQVRRCNRPTGFSCPCCAGGSAVIIATQQLLLFGLPAEAYAVETNTRALLRGIHFGSSCAHCVCVCAFPHTLFLLLFQSLPLAYHSIASPPPLRVCRRCSKRLSVARRQCPTRVSFAANARLPL
jgi:hypothetical protein